MEIKQVIVVRKDLKMNRGKIAAQAAHASMKIFFDRVINTKEKKMILLILQLIFLKKWNFGEKVLLRKHVLE